MAILNDATDRNVLRSGTLRIDVVNSAVGLENLPFSIAPGQQLLLTARAQTNGPSGPGIPDNIGPLYVPFYRPHPSEKGMTQVIVYDIQANAFTVGIVVDFVLVG